MTMVWWRGEQFLNFGDEINRVIWPNIIPQVINDKESLFIGIGTLLQDGITYPERTRKIVFSSGVGYGNRPVALDNTWKIYCVRGPMTADALGLNRDMAITDGAAGRIIG